MYNILFKLANELSNKGYSKEADKIIDILDQITKMFNDKDEQKVDDSTDIAANTIGLREDGTVENMNQGFTLEPFFSDYGSLQ